MLTPVTVRYKTLRRAVSISIYQLRWGVLHRGVAAAAAAAEPTGLVAVAVAATGRRACASSQYPKHWQTSESPRSCSRFEGTTMAKGARGSAAACPRASAEHRLLTVCFLWALCAAHSVAQPSDYVPLSDESFMPAFEALWEAHVEFGTTKSHKKLLGKKRKRAVETVEGASAMPGSSAAAGCGRTPSAHAGVSSVAPPQAGATATQAGAAGAAGAAAGRPPRLPAAEPLANKGRWGSTMAARLLGGV